MPFCRQPDAQQVLPAYERAMLREVERICAAIPHRDLAIQWDVCIEMIQWDGRVPTMPSFPGMEHVFADNFRRLAAGVPAGVELGFHLCYGDLDGKHFVDPVDATKMVELANLSALPEQVHFAEVGYYREARPSSEDFVSAREAGYLPPNVRFQVSLPTPLAVVMPFCRQPDAQQILPAYERAMLREVERICAAIPHRDLAIQWDVCIEMIQWDGRMPTMPPLPAMEHVFPPNFHRLAPAL